MLWTNAWSSLTEFAKKLGMRLGNPQP
jgi:hypothetical protein